MLPFLNSPYLQAVRAVIMHLPEAEEYVCYGTPAFRVRKKLLARLREDGETLAVHADDRDPWIALDSNVFFVTDHYRAYPVVLVKLSAVRPEHLQQLLFEAWRDIAPKRALKAYEADTSRT